MRDHGLPFREGHHVASEIVTYARAEGIGPLEFPYEKAREIYAETVKDTDFPQELPLSEAEFRAALDPVAIVRGRATSGGPQPAEMKRMLDEATARLDRQESWVADRRAHIDAALGKLDADFQSLLTE